MSGSESLTPTLRQIVFHSFNMIGTYISAAFSFCIDVLIFLNFIDILPNRFNWPSTIIYFEILKSGLLKHTADLSFNFPVLKSFSSSVYKLSVGKQTLTRNFEWTNQLKAGFVKQIIIKYVGKTESWSGKKTLRHKNFKIQ